VEDECPKCPPEGLPAWMGTFADLMSLLMCFFVLLLSFSEMDVKKFKQIAGSMKFAFGVQNKIELKDIPKGTSVVAILPVVVKNSQVNSAADNLQAPRMRLPQQGPRQLIKSR